MDKYYWILYECISTYYSTRNRFETVIKHTHPFEFVQELSYKNDSYNHMLLNWKEITEEEYNIFKR